VQNDLEIWIYVPESDIQICLQPTYLDSKMSSHYLLSDRELSVGIFPCAFDHQETGDGWDKEKLKPEEQYERLTYTEWILLGIVDRNM